jgi:hypothetical protein
MKLNPRVVRVKPGRGHTLSLVFSNGETGVFDMSPYLDRSPFFGELRDPAYFRRVRVTSGTFGWPHGQDLCPDTVYRESVRQPGRARPGGGSQTRQSPRHRRAA